MSILTIGAVWQRLARGCQLAWKDLWSEKGFAFASPAFAFPLAYVLAYGLGAILYADRMGDRASLFAFAVVAGLACYFVGIGLAWPQSQPRDRLPEGSDQIRGLLIAAFALVAVGVVASVAYLIAIGGIPLFMPSVEQARVEAAERGGAALRVTALLSLPGVWLIATWAGCSRKLLAMLIAVVATAIVAGLQVLTANRAPAFLTFEVAVVAWLLGAGIWRVRLGGLAAIAGVAIGLVILAGAIGGFRLSATPTTWRDPQVARGVASGDLVGLTGEAIGNYLIVPIQNFSSTLDAVPRLIGWRLGYTYAQPIITALPGRQTTFDQDLKAALAQDYAGGGTVPSMLGESYANFGPFGWLIIPAGIGGLLALLYRLARQQRTVAATALYSYAIVHMANATISGVVVANLFPYIGFAILGGAALGGQPLRAMRRRLSFVRK